jgi:Trk K+ transport system NAD-binding subunit
VERVTVHSSRALRDLALRRHGCSVLAIERDGTFLRATAETILESGDGIYVCGATEAMRGLDSLSPAQTLL